MVSIKDTRMYGWLKYFFRKSEPSPLFLQGVEAGKLPITSMASTQVSAIHRVCTSKYANKLIDEILEDYRQKPLPSIHYDPQVPVREARKRSEASKSAVNTPV